jgi:lipopolysaccharide/colanic/teichoic acid biosynthesis glycosyltransferase
MINNSEPNGPELSFENDPRVTLIGKYLRQLHLDEIPQFINVLKGDMALTGIRPEREYYINQIISKAPELRFLFLQKPGLTSLGQLKFGYAKNVDEMIERLWLDYYNNLNYSLLNDVRIAVLTIILIVTGKNSIS